MLQLYFGPQISLFMDFNDFSDILMFSLNIMNMQIGYLPCDERTMSKLLNETKFSGL